MEVFDFVVVGAGSAGCVLANRLTMKSDTTLCLIEDGPRDRHPFIHIPAGIVGLVKDRRHFWRFDSSRQPGAGDRAVEVPRGRTLGGSSAINGMVYTRGHPLDYDEWAALGNTGWSFADVLPYFKRSENNETYRDSPWHGRGGPLNVTDLKSHNPMVDVLLEAAASLQMPIRQDFNAEDQEGFGKRQVTQRNGRRESAATAYLNPVRHRKNLKIVTGGRVLRVLLEERRAIGIEVEENGERRSIRASREVILAAGAIGSPTILMLSGIGDGNDLKSRNLEVAHHLPGVGKNLQDHVAAGIKHMSPSDKPYGLSWKALPYLTRSVFDYALFRRGLFASNIMEGGGFLRSKPDLPRPDLQFIFMPAHRVPGRIFAPGHGYTLYAAVMRPKSRGSVMLSDDPFGKPVIDFNLLSEEADLQLLLGGVKTARRILAAPAFDHYRGEEVRPGAKAQSDAELVSFIRQTAQTVFHPVGTCKMGIDDTAVVDTQLRVRGTQRLRVVDASIMPTIIGGNTSAPTMMIAEKASEMILQTD